MSVDFNLLFGPFVGGTWLNTALIAFELTEAWGYFRKYREDPSWTRCLVAGVVLVDIAGSLSSFALVYQLTVLAWGNLLMLALVPWSFAVAAIMTGIPQTVLQAVQVFRIYKLSQSRLLAALLAPIVLMGLGGCIASTTIVSLFPHYSQRRKVASATTIWLATSAGSDICISAVLVTLLVRARRKVSMLKFQSGVSRPLSRLLRAAIETGCIPACWTLIALATSWWNPYTNVAPGLMICSGRVASLTLFYNLNLRKSTARGLYLSNGQVDRSISPNGSEPASTHATPRSTFKFAAFGGRKIPRVPIKLEDIIYDLSEQRHSSLQVPLPGVEAPLSDANELDRLQATYDKQRYTFDRTYRHGDAV